MARVIVTGGAGFIGSHVVDLIRASGDVAIVIDNLSTGLRANISADVEIHEVDISIRKAVLSLSSLIGSADAIVHCAAQASVVVSTEDPCHDLKVNVAGTINVLDLADTLHCPLVFTSTGGAIYGEDAVRPTPEATAIEPVAPYGASKAAAEVYIRMWAKKCNVPHAICRRRGVRSNTRTSSD